MSFTDGFAIGVIIICTLYYLAARRKQLNTERYAEEQKEALQKDLRDRITLLENAITHTTANVKTFEEKVKAVLRL